MTIKEEVLYSNKENINSKQLAVLKKHFPQFFDKHGGFIQEKMLEIVEADESDLSKESYSLNWLGKSYARLLTNLPPTTLINEDIAHNQLSENLNSKNLLIRGDNLEVLKHMSHAYSEKVKMIYIDPPYNTGSDGFVYNDDRRFTKEQLSELAGIDLDEAERVLEFTDKGSSSHSAWLTFICPRLYLARELLTDDGVIFISIDDNESSQLTLLCNEIFGEFNSIGPIIHNKLNAKNDTLNVQKNHDYILCYRKMANYSSNGKVLPSLLRSDIKTKPVYKDGDRYYFLNDPITTRGEGGTLNNRENLGYTVYFNPSNNDFIGVNDYDRELAKTSNSEEDVYYDNNDLISQGYIQIRPPRVRGSLGAWTWDIDNFNANKDEIAISKTKNGYSVRKRAFVEKKDIQEQQGSLFYENRNEGNSRSIIDFSTNEGSTQLTDILGINGIFSNPKNTKLLDYLIQLIPGKNFTFLDFFAGSGASLDALITLNCNDGGKRNFIGVQISEECESGSLASKHGYRTIFDITKDRIEKSALKIKTDSPDCESDLGFKIYETVEDFRPPTDEESPLTNLTMFDDEVLTDEQLHTLLITWALYDGCLLTTPVITINFAGYLAHYCDGRLYLIASEFSTDALKSLLMKLDEEKEFSPRKTVLFGSNFDSAKQMELHEALKNYANKKSLELDVVVRY